MNLSELNSWVKKMPESLGINLDSDNDIKIAKLYAFNAYYDGIEDNVDDCLDGCFAEQGDGNFFIWSFLQY